MKLLLLLLGLTMVTAQVLPGGFTDLEVNDEKALEAAAAAVSTLARVTGASNPVSPCGKNIDLVGVEKAASQVVAGTKYKLTLRLATHTGDDCATRVEKVCQKISVWTKLPFMCPGDRPCHELVQQENIECTESLDYTTRELKQIIDEKEAIIKHKEATITNLEASIRRNEAEIRRNEAEIQRKEAIIQNQLNCPIDGKWSNFSEFGQCSASCGEGMKERTRTCTNPPPQNGGLQCQGPSNETENCVLVDNCPVEGGWSNYTSWSVCSQTCGNGTKVRSRTCTQPQPQFGGDHCDGRRMETESCFLIQNCPTGNVIFITGGERTSTSTEVLDPAGSCSRLTSPLPDRRRAHSISRLGGDLVLCGGFDGDTSTSCISARSPLGPWVHHSQLTSYREDHASVATGETIHVFAGGLSGPGGTAETLEDGTRRWKEHQLPNFIGRGPCAVEIHNTVYVTGGSSALTQTWKWNTTDQQWTRLADMDGRGRNYHGCAVMRTGRKSLLLVAGGTGGPNNSLRTSAIYDIEKNTWRSTGELNQVRFAGVMVNLDEDVYMLGGADAGWNALNTVEKFNVATNEWVTTNLKMKKGRFRFAALSVEKADDYC